MVLDAEMTPNGLLEHYISKGIYLRVLNMNANELVIGHVHKVRHLSILLTGSIKITVGGSTRTFHAPYIFEVEDNSRKIIITLTNCSMVNIVAHNEEEHLDSVQLITDKHIDMSASTNAQQLVDSAVSQLKLELKD